ncbi:unnamed protein product, partial [Symbiodinium necroappetens]
MPTNVPEAVTKPEFGGSPTGVSREQVHNIKAEAKLYHMANMSMEQRALMERAGQHHSDEQRALAAQQVQAAATLMMHQSQESVKQSVVYQTMAEQSKAAAAVQLQRLQEEQRLQEQAYQDEEWLAQQQLNVMKEEAAARERNRLAMQRALQIQQFQLSQHAAEHYYWQQEHQRQQSWQDTFVDEAQSPRAAAGPTHTNQAPAREVHPDLAGTKATAQAAQELLKLERQQGAAPQVVTAPPANDCPTAAHPPATPLATQPQAAASPAPSQIRDHAWDTHVSDAAYKRQMEREHDVNMASPTQLQHELDATTAQLAGHVQDEEQQVDWAAKAVELEALMEQCRAKARAASTPLPRATGPTPDSTPAARNLSAQFMRVASGIQEAQVRGTGSNEPHEDLTFNGYKRKFDPQDEWPAPPKAMPRTTPAARRCLSAGLPVPPPPLTPEQYAQKMQELAASIPAPPPVLTAAKSGSQAVWTAAPRGKPSPEATATAPDSSNPPFPPPAPRHPVVVPPPSAPSAPATGSSMPPPQAADLHLGAKRNPAPEAERNSAPDSTPEAQRNPPPNSAPEAKGNPPPSSAPEAEPNARRNSAPEASTNPAVPVAEVAGDTK